MSTEQPKGSESQVNRPGEILHVATQEDWNKFDPEEDYYPSAYLSEGFIHCCTEEQLSGVLSRYFKGKRGLRKLYIDPTLLKNNLKWELAPSINEDFPHIYGPINREAIVGMKVLPVQPNADGSIPPRPPSPDVESSSESENSDNPPIE